MATRLSKPSRTNYRQQTAEQAINEREDEGVSSDDLEITKIARKELDTDAYVEKVTAGASDGSVTAEDDDAPPASTRVEWSDDEDNAMAVYEAFKNRKSLKRKRAAASTRKARATAGRSSTSMVGKRAKQHRLNLNNDSKPKLKTFDTFGDDSDSDAQLPEVKLPDYVRNRKSKFDAAKDMMGEAGLLTPPDYDGIGFSDDERLEELREKPVLSDIKPQRKYEDIILKTSAGIIPAPIAQWLRNYQVEGAEFLHEKFVYQRGGILGDDMGLGKTIQVIAFLTAAFGKTGDERDAKRMRKMRRAGGFYPRILLICPGSLMENWRSELQKWGWWQIYVYHGSVGDKESAHQAAQSGRAEILITTYATYRGNRSALNTIDWDCVVADECHIMKARSSEITQAMNEVNALCRIGLTGTAIQNKYEEMWTLLNWTNPGRFGSLATWRSCICEPLKMGQAHDATYQQLAKARKTANSLVKNLLPQFFLRRMKSLIKDQLPKKSDRVVFCPLTETQTIAYENYVSGDIIDFIRTSSDPCDCGSGKKRGWCCYTKIPGHSRWQNHVFPSIVTLQKLANHIAQLIPSSVDPHEKQGKDLDALKIAMPEDWEDLYSQRDSILNYANTEFCGKWAILKKLLQFWHANGDKVLVFSHSVRLLKMLQMLFASKTSYNVSYLDGGMSYEERAQTVNDFNSNPLQFVFLISTRAGGVGLNITSANKVVVVDPNWNPAYDLQAQDRAYRIGQTRDVEVFRLVSAGTIEEIVYARQIYKQQQANIGYNASNERRYFRGVQDQKGKKGEIFGLANLFSFQGDSVVLRDIVNKTNVAESRAGVTIIGLSNGGGGNQNSQTDSIDSDDDDYVLGGEDEDEAMSQVAKLIADGAVDDDDVGTRLDLKRKKTDAVQAILASAGVQYTHENSEVIGTSKVEERLSKRAAENENHVDFLSRHVFASQRAGEEGEAASPGVEYRYGPAEEVRRRQFCSMARTWGYEDVTEFALVVEGWTQAQRRNCLEKFYRLRRRKVVEGGGGQGG